MARGQGVVVGNSTSKESTHFTTARSSEPLRMCRDLDREAYECISQGVLWVGSRTYTNQFTVPLMYCCPYQAEREAVAGAKLNLLPFLELPLLAFSGKERN